jgi:hypothetical protein
MRGRQVLLARTPESSLSARTMAELQGEMQQRNKEIRRNLDRFLRLLMAKFLADQAM